MRLTGRLNPVTYLLKSIKITLAGTKLSSYCRCKSCSKFQLQKWPVGFNPQCCSSVTADNYLWLQNRRFVAAKWILSLLNCFLSVLCLFVCLFLPSFLFQLQKKCCRCKVQKCSHRHTFTNSHRLDLETTNSCTCNSKICRRPWKTGVCEIRHRVRVMHTL